MNHIMTVVLDRAHARFFDVGPTATVELASLRSPATRGGKYHSDRADAPGRGENAYHGRLREEERSHITAVAARLVALDTDPAFEFVLVGPVHLTRALRRALPRSLDGRCIGTAHLDFKRLTPAIVQREARRLQAEWVQRLPHPPPVRSPS